MDKETFGIEIPFGAHDSEMMGWEYTIPAGYTAEIKDGKVIIKKNKYTDEQLSQAVHNCLEELEEVHGWNYVYVDGESIPISKIKEWNKDGRKKRPAEWSDEDIKKIRSEEYTKGFNDAAFGGRLKEWCDEDNIIKNVISYLNGEYGFKSGDDEYDYRKGLVKQLKSLHPHWKPTAEQMEYLAKAIDTLANEGDCKTAYHLNEIRKGLKKLI